MRDFESVDFFTDKGLVDDPYPYFSWLRAQCPVRRESHRDVVMVTGFEEASEIYRNSARFSSCNSVTGPFPGFPVPLEGDDVSDLIAAHRDELPFSDQLPTMDPPEHKQHRGLLMRLLTPKRLKENEEAMWDIADRVLDEYFARDDGEFVSGFASTYTMLVIADLLGVPEEDHELFRRALHTGTVGSTRDGSSMHQNPLEFLYETFSTYIEERRASPKADVLNDLAHATFPDGSTPEVIDVVRIASNLFAAGQETTNRLLSYAVQVLGERPEIQQQLRDDPSLIEDFVEECLRIESPVKGDFRLTRTPVTIGGVDLPAGTTVMVVNGAANRDPRTFDDPDEFRIERENSRWHLAFGKGPHACPGGPLARAEGRISIQRLLERTSDIRISEAHHGPPGERHYDYVPTYILRGLSRIHLDLDVVPAAVTDR